MGASITLQMPVLHSSKKGIGVPKNATDCLGERHRQQPRLKRAGWKPFPAARVYHALGMPSWIWSAQQDSALFFVSLAVIYKQHIGIRWECRSDDSPV